MTRKVYPPPESDALQATRLRRNRHVLAQRISAEATRVTRLAVEVRDRSQARELAEIGGRLNAIAADVRPRR